MSDKDLQTINISQQKPKRSSLKLANLMDPKEIMNYSKKKRNSVCWKLGKIKKDEGKKKTQLNF